jgi:DNA-binding NtrC family response regulator
MGKHKTILFAEPQAVLPRELEEFVRERGYKAVRVSSLKETLLALQDMRVDAAVLSASLVEEDCEFISVIKNIRKDLPIIVCAEKNTPELESRIRQQRIFYYHIKSFGVQDLEMAISNAVNGLQN